MRQEAAERFDDPDEALEALWHTEEVRDNMPLSAASQRFLRFRVTPP